MEGCSAASGSVCAWYVAAGVAACCRKMKLQGFLIPVDRAFQSVLRGVGHVDVCAGRRQVVREKAMDAHGQARCTHLQLVAPVKHS